MGRYIAGSSQATLFFSFSSSLFSVHMKQIAIPFSGYKLLLVLNFVFRMTSLTDCSVRNFLLQWLKRLIFPPGPITAINCIDGLIGALTLFSLLPVVKIVIIASIRSPKIFNLCTLQHRMIVFHADPSVWHQFFRGSIVKGKFPRLYVDCEIRNAHQSSK